MPIYEYECPICYATKEVLQKVDELPPWACCAVSTESGPVDIRMRRIMSAPARAQFKGSGFYETDYKRRGK